MRSLPEIIAANQQQFTALDFVTAQELVEAHGAALIGQTVWTPPIGNYPGGNAVVTEIGHDPNAPEIVFLVQHPSEGEMGIFDYERVRLVD